MENKIYKKYNNRKIYNSNKKKYTVIETLLNDLFDHINEGRSLTSFFIFRQRPYKKPKDETNKILSQGMGEMLTRCNLNSKIIENTMKYGSVENALITLYKLEHPEDPESFESTKQNPNPVNKKPKFIDTKILVPGSVSP